MYERSAAFNLDCITICRLDNYIYNYTFQLLKISTWILSTRGPITSHFTCQNFQHTKVLNEYICA